MKNESEVPEAPEALCLCACQGSIQAKIRPGVWIPIIRSLHVYEETWKISANPIVCSKDVLQAISKLQHRSLRGNVFTVSYVEEKAERSVVEIIVFTRCRNVYVIKLKFVNEESAGCVACVRSFSSGIFPTWFPLNFVFSSILFFVPFYDKGRNAKWISILKSQMTLPIEVTKSGRKC
ncbi:uncharacterized protein TNIN_74971 [Trichonephila inaurata madagascariensis]|uniref:Uncharacterized protein n=1 Tax=Trichonephila inaurata madagascariensis TaxID=2747483 RepID=A0A8X6MD25_9ARAC|nr:uncharacterized protein TNIN_74971 [Trichonephila inaurata madagascariensis]